MKVDFDNPLRAKPVCECECECVLVWCVVCLDLMVFVLCFLCSKMVRAPAAGRSLPEAASSKQDTISDEEIERQLRALGVD